MYGTTLLDSRSLLNVKRLPDVVLYFDPHAR